MYAYDTKTKQELSQRCTFMILYNNSWIPLDLVDQKKIESGTVWKIKATCEGYEEEVFSLLIDWYQDEFVVTAALKKKE